MDNSAQCICEEFSCGMRRRAFLRMLGMGTLASLGGGLASEAKALDGSVRDIFPDKRLDPSWVNSLFDRGVPEIFRGDQLKRVSMPIGGICNGLDLNLSGDGNLVGWQIFTYQAKIAQAFSLKTISDGKTDIRLLDQKNFPNLTFRGEYPMAKLEYADASCPVKVTLEAFSPFIPLNVDDSSFPATIFNFTLKNTSATPVEVTLAGSLENGICDYSRLRAEGVRRNEVIRKSDFTLMNCSILQSSETGKPSRPDIVFEDWSKGSYEGWKVEGEAFGSKPESRLELKKRRPYFKDEGDKCYASSVGSREQSSFTGKLTSSPFTIGRRYINVSLCGGSYPKETCVNLIVDGKVVQSIAGHKDDMVAVHFFDARQYEGNQAAIEVVTSGSKRGYRYITVGNIVFSDRAGDGTPMDTLPDYGTMGLALLGKPANLCIAEGNLGQDGKPSEKASVPLSQSLIGTLGRTVQLRPGESSSVTFVIAWFFPNLEMDKLGKVGRYYTNQFHSAEAVLEYVSTHYPRLTADTRLWNETWYDSTLPYWFLDRTFLNISSLASSEAYRFADGRFYAYEGAPAPNFLGTCTHVWHYAQSVARVFPALERDTRERVDLGVGLNPETGIIGFRGEYNMNLAVDGQCGTIMRFYREHQMSPDSSFLKRNWENIKTTFNPLFALDKAEVGLLDGPQNNTLDCTWYGQNSWMSSMYIGALLAGEQMAKEMQDTAFAERCHRIAESGKQNLLARLYNGEYFNSRIDPAHADAMNSGNGCFIDQILGQSWAKQIGLPLILPTAETRSALKALWKYNFFQNVQSYRLAAQGNRKYREHIRPGESGMIMCTFPRDDWDFIKSSGGQDSKDYSHRFASYFDEIWSGQEYQVASHMLWEGMVLEGMTIVRAIHDRYSPPKRNPWSEEEAGIHYARAMASYGAFIGICGFEYNGPKGDLGFSPKLSPENFRAPFIAAEGWGTYSQSIENGKMKVSVIVKWGQLKLQSFAVNVVGMPKISQAKARVSGQEIGFTLKQDGDKMLFQLPKMTTLKAGQTFSVELLSK